jgi:hypothetical protein
MNKYSRTFPTTHVDVYRVLKEFQVLDPGVQHAIKKLLFAGQRGHKDKRQDLLEAIDAIRRSIEMMEEESSKIGSAIQDNSANHTGTEVDVEFSRGIYEW